MTIAARTPAAAASTPHNRIRIGYARVSTRSQDHQSQLDALAAAHCREVVVETASTRKDRPKLRAVLAQLQAGDTLVIYKPDRVARSMKELLVFLEDELHARGIVLEILTGVCAGVHRPEGTSLADRLLFAVAALAAELERELIRERTRDGLAAAAAAGRRGGRPVALTVDQLDIARARQARGESVTAIARHLGVGRSTLYRALDTAGAADAEDDVDVDDVPPVRARRVQMNRQTGWRAEHPDAVRVDRSTRWGNPFTGDEHGGRAAAVAAYRQALADGTLPGVGTHPPVTVAAIRTELAGRDLACWCPIGEPCHAEVLLDVAAGAAVREDRAL